jgi:hypothetical protein
MLVLAQHNKLVTARKRERVYAARIRYGIAEDPARAIGSAKEPLETVLKTVIGDHGHKSRDDIPELPKKAQAQLDPDPKSASGSETLRRTLSNRGQVVHGVASCAAFTERVRGAARATNGR